MSTTMEISEEQRAEAEDLVRVYALRRRMTRAIAAGELTGADVDEVLRVGAVLDAMCEAFRRRWHPRVGRVVSAGYGVYTVSPRGQRIRTVIDCSGRVAVSS